MTNKGMLGNISLAEFQRLRNDLEQKCAGDDGEIWLDAFKRFLRKENPWDDLDLVRVDRTILPTYPDWVKEVLYPELESTGPAEFDTVELWLHDMQKKDDSLSGYTIHKYLKDNDMIKDCLGLRDLEEIQKKGIVFFRKHFKGKAVSGWKSIVLINNGQYGVPYLYESGDHQVCIHWKWLVDGWSACRPALLFSN